MGIATPQATRRPESKDQKLPRLAMNTSIPGATNRVSTSQGRYLRDCLTVLEESLPRDCKQPRSSSSSSSSEDDGEKDPQSLDRQEQRRQEAAECLSTLVPYIFGIESSKRRRLNDDDEMMNRDKSRCRVKDTSPASKSGTTDGLKSRNEADNENESDKERYTKQLKQLGKENEELNDRRKSIVRRYGNLIDAYESGLRHISKLNDLTYAPDNIMEGNFCDKKL